MKIVKSIELSLKSFKFVLFVFILLQNLTLEHFFWASAGALRFGALNYSASEKAKLTPRAQKRLFGAAKEI